MQSLGDKTIIVHWFRNGKLMSAKEMKLPVWEDGPSVYTRWNRQLMPLERSMVNTDVFHLDIRMERK